MSRNYDFPYSKSNVYGHVVELLRRSGIGGRGIHLDVGCGFGPMAETLVADTGLTYVGIDAAADGLASLAARGFETHEITLGNADETVLLLERALGNRTLTSISCIDVLEHVSDPKALLDAMRALAGSKSIPLVTSVPNVTHIDVAAKQLFGRFDSTDAGILDGTHLTHFTHEAITKLLNATGWRPVDAYDVEYLESDQHFPRSHVALASGSLLARFLQEIRCEADNFHITNQLVRLSVPAAPHPNRAPKQQTARFLSVLVPVEGAALGLLWEFMLCLFAQTDADFDVILLGIDLNYAQQLDVLQIIEAQVPDLASRCRFVSCHPRSKVAAVNKIEALNTGIGNAHGSYIATVDPFVILKSNWVTVFRELADGHQGAALLTAHQMQPRKRIGAPQSSEIF